VQWYNEKGKPFSYLIGLLKMKQSYTQKQIAEFAEFCKRHGITFNNLIEYNSAIEQYYYG